MGGGNGKLHFSGQPIQTNVTDFGFGKRLRYLYVLEKLF